MSGIFCLVYLSGIVWPVYIVRHVLSRYLLSGMFCPFIFCPGIFCQDLFCPGISYLSTLLKISVKMATRNCHHLAKLAKLAKLDHPIISVSLFRHSHPSSNSSITLFETLLRVFGTLFPPISGLSLNKFLHHPRQHLFHSTHCLFHAVSSSPASKHTYSLFHTPLKFTTFLTHLQLSTGQLRTARNTSEHPRIHQHHWFYGGYIKRLFPYLLTYFVMLSRAKL